MPQSFDGQLNYRAWNEEPPAWSYLGPFADNQERLTQQAISVMFMTADEIAENVRPPIPQVDLFPDRFGLPELQDRQARIEDIVQAPRSIPHPASTWYSGGPAGYTGAPRYENNGLGLA